MATRTEIVREWQLSLDKIFVNLFKTKGMTEEVASQRIFEEALKLTTNLPKIDRGVEVDMALGVYQKIYGKYVSPKVIAQQKLAADIILDDDFKLLAKYLPSYAREAVNYNFKLATNIMTSGNFTQDQALDLALGKYRHLTINTARQGRWTIQNLYNRAVRSKMVQATNTIAERIAEDLGTSVYWVSEHAGARPLCAPYQGQFWADVAGEYMIDGELQQVGSWDDTSFGEVAGLFGVNCRHLKFPVTAEIKVSEIRTYNTDTLTDLGSYLASMVEPS